MTPDPQPTPPVPTAPAEPKYEHEETGRLLQEAARCPHDVTIPTWDTVGLFAAQLARADERVRWLEAERDQLNDIITGLCPETGAMHEILARAGCVSVNKQQYDALCAKCDRLARENRRLRTIIDDDQSDLRMAGCPTSLARIKHDLAALATRKEK
jgi:hypothetical protein